MPLVAVLRGRGRGMLLSPVCTDLRAEYDNNRSANSGLANRDGPRLLTPNRWSSRCRRTGVGERPSTTSDVNAQPQQVKDAPCPGRSRYHNEPAVSATSWRRATATNPRLPASSA